MTPSFAEPSSYPLESAPASVADATFLAEFDRLYAGRLEHRRATMRRVFEYLLERRGPEWLILETGCLRAAGNWGGDGQSTYLFDRFVARHGGRVLSVDLDPTACAAARSLVGQRTSVHCAESVAFLWGYRPPRPVDCVYLDSFDLDWSRPHASSLHHLKELTALLPRLSPGCLVVVDDNFGGRGKGEYIRAFMDDLGVPPLFDEYQIAWVLPEGGPWGPPPSSQGSRSSAEEPAASEGEH